MYHCYTKRKTKVLKGLLGKDYKHKESKLKSFLKKISAFFRNNNSDPGTASACLTDLDAEVVSDILAKPGRYYANVHTADFPAGAVRGQLQKLKKD